MIKTAQMSGQGGRLYVLNPKFSLKSSLKGATVFLNFSKPSLINLKGEVFHKEYSDFEGGSSWQSLQKYLGKSWTDDRLLLLRIFRFPFQKLDEPTNDKVVLLN